MIVYLSEPGGWLSGATGPCAGRPECAQQAPLILPAPDARKYDPDAVVDWCVKLARIAEGYISFEHPRVSPVEHTDRNDYNVQVQADLSRLNTEQLIALKHLAHG
jgi:hypothetical protein